jgi:NAD(P) transhydrogenase subunit alpha
MKIGIPKEIRQGETRVASIPSMVSTLTRDKHEVLVERDAGSCAFFSDVQYTQAGATITGDARSLFQQADVILKVQPPQSHEAELFREGSTYIGFFAPLSHPAIVTALNKRRVTSFSMEYVPRITRAQSMDALSSMATVAGYKAVLLATEKLGKMFPLLMTAAGTVPPATVLVIGAGVAGLQAIATAKRLGAKVEAFDVRAAVRDQVKSLGAAFIDMEISENLETKGGYAKEQSQEFLKKQQEVLSARLPKVHVVITTAQVFGKQAPIIITEEMVKLLPQGSVIVDIAAEQGGNCELTRPGESIEKHGVIIIGAVNLPATVPVDASLMYSKNLLNLFKHIFPTAGTIPDFNDEIVKGACITHGGAVVNASVRDAIQHGGSRS